MGKHGQPGSSPPRRARAGSLERALLLCSSLAVLLVALASPGQAGRFGVPDPGSDPPGYFILTGPDVPPDPFGNMSWGDNRHFIDFFIEVTGTTLRVDLYDPGLVTNNGLDVFFGGTVGTVTYVLWDPGGTPVATQTMGSDTVATDLALFTLYDGPAAPGVYRLSADMDDDPLNDDQDINAFGVFVPGYDFYSHYFTGGETNLAGGTISEPVLLYPLIVESTPSTFMGEDITGIDVSSHDMESASNDAPPELLIQTTLGRSATLQVSQDAQVFTTNLRGLNLADGDGRDHGIYTLAVSQVGLVGEATVPPTDLNIFTLQVNDYESGLDPAAFPVLGGDPSNPRRIYYSRDDLSAPLKEALVHWVQVVSGPDPPLVGLASELEVTVEVVHPAPGYDLTGIDVTTSMSRDAQFSDPVVVGGTGGLSGVATGRDIRITGDVTADSTGTVSYRTTFTPTAPARLYLTGDGSDLQGGTLPTQGIYQTPFVQPPLAETFGPIHMLLVTAIDDTCQAVAQISGDFELCEGEGTTLNAGGSTMTDCPGVTEYRWLQDGMEIEPYPGPPAIAVSPNADTTYEVEIRCSTLPTCTDSVAVPVTVHPEVIAEAGPEQQVSCASPMAMLDGSASGGSGMGYGYAWSPPGDVSDPSLPNPTTTIAGTYTLTVTDLASGCTGVDTVLVVEDPSGRPTAEAGPDMTLTCADASVRLEGMASGGDGSMGYGYSWEPAAQVSNPGLPSPSTMTPGTYTLTVVDVATGCTATDTVEVSEDYAEPTAEAGPALVLDCMSPTVRLLGEASGGNGSAGYGYSWEPAGNVSDPSADMPTTSIAGTYTLTVTDLANGCTSVDTVEVTRLVAPDPLEPSAVDLAPAASPLTVRWLDPQLRAMLRVEWQDVFEPSYDLHAGTLDGLRSTGADHAGLACALPMPSAEVAAPSEDSYFLAVSTNCDGVDSAYGRDSAGAERPDAASASGWPCP